MISAPARNLSHFPGATPKLLAAPDADAFADSASVAGVSGLCQGLGLGASTDRRKFGQRWPISANTWPVLVSVELGPTLADFGPILA